MDLGAHRGKAIAIRYIKKHFDDADVMLQISSCPEHGCRIYIYLDFGQAEGCYACEEVDLNELEGPNAKAYTKGLLDIMITNLKICAGRT